MTIVTDTIDVDTRGDAEVCDVTRPIAALVARHGMVEGHVVVFVPGSTAALTTVEFEPGLVRDLPDFFERIIPARAHYHHEDAWHDGNGHSHVRASLLGPSLTIPFSDGHLMLGTWQQIVLIDFDNRPRQRRLVVQLCGERAAAEPAGD